MSTIEERRSADEQRLAELGYRQELSRTWSGFQNFAISFTIISILAGCFTTYGQGFNNGGPVAISWGWPLISPSSSLISPICSCKSAYSKIQSVGGKGEFFSISKAISK